MAWPPAAGARGEGNIGDFIDRSTDRPSSSDSGDISIPRSPRGNPTTPPPSRCNGATGRNVPWSRTPSATPRVLDRCHRSALAGEEHFRALKLRVLGAPERCGPRLGGSGGARLGRPVVATKPRYTDAMPSANDFMPSTRTAPDPSFPGDGVGGGVRPDGRGTRSRARGKRGLGTRIFLSRTADPAEVLIVGCAMLTMKKGATCNPRERPGRNTRKLQSAKTPMPRSTRRRWRIGPG